MKRLFLVIVATAVWHAYAITAIGEEVSLRIRYDDANSVSQDIESLHRLIEKVKERGSVSISQSSGIEETIERLIESKIVGITVGRRQELVRNTIGEDYYVALEGFLMKQLRSSEPSQQKIAVDLLAYPLFAVSAVDEIKPFVFHSDRFTQFLAVKSLVYLDVGGANYLLGDMILSGVLMDYELSLAITALYISNSKNLDSIANALLQKNMGGATFKALLPVLRKRDEYRQIVADTFKSNMFHVPDRNDLPMEQKWKARAEHDLLKEIFSDVHAYMADGEIRKKVLMYASTHHNGLYALPLLILEKSGQDIGYFTEMLKENQLAPQKRHVLELIISRMQKGQRLE